MSNQNVQILIVDDEPSILRLLQKELSGSVHAVLTSTSGEEALTLLQQEKIDILITDLRMPIMGGLELISIAIQYQPNLQCIIMSGYGQKPDTIKALQLGVIDFQEKPIEPKKLRRTIDKAILNIESIRTENIAKKEQQKRLETIVNASGQGLFGLDTKGRITFINPAALNMLERKNDQLIGMDFYEIAYFTKIGAPPLTKSDCPVFASIEQKEPVSGFDYILWVKNGSNFPVKFTSTPIIINGKINGAVISIIDTRELKETKKLLQEKEQYLSSILENTLSGVLLVDIESHVINYANPAALSMIDHPKEAVIGRECHEFICHNKQGKCPFTNLGNDAHLEENIVLGKNKKQIPVIKSVMQISLHGRRYLLENFIDITEQKKSARALEKSDKAFDAIIECSLDGSIIVDTQGYVQFVNKAALNIFGRTKEELFGNIFGYPMTADETTELNIVRPDGEKTIVEMRVAPTEWNDTPALLASLRDITMRKRMEEHIKYLANHDQLTGLPNRYLLPDRMKQISHLARRNSKQFAVFFLDLDNFKTINDTLGHDAGDTVLKKTATRLKKVIRTSDTVARIGGDEFAAILYDIYATNDIAGMAQKMIEMINAPIMIKDQECHVGVSIGISIYPDDSDNPEKLINYADIAMYKAKEKGKNLYCFFNDKGVQD